MPSKKTLVEIEEKNVDIGVSEALDDGVMANAIDYFEKLDNPYLPKDEYDVVIYKVIKNPSYLFGAVVSRAMYGLKQNGLFVVDYSGAAINVEETRIIAEFGGMIYKNHDSKNGVIVFRKPEENEHYEVSIDIDMVE